MNDAVLAQLETLIAGADLGAGRDWLEQSAARLAAADSPNRLLGMLSPQVRLQLGNAALDPSATLQTAHGELSLADWSVEDLGRLYLLAHPLGNGRVAAEPVLAGFFRLAENREKASLMHGLALLDEGDALKRYALDCGRTNSRMLFEALALRNPYPASVYTEPEFNQLVLKGLFMDIGIRHYCTMGVNPKEANDVDLAAGVMELLPAFCAEESVVAIGEIGYDDISDAEERFFAEQMQLAMELGLLVLVHTPHRDKKRGTERTLALVKEIGIAEERVLIDHLNEITLSLVMETGCRRGHSIFPHTKLSEERMVALLK